MEISPEVKQVIDEMKKSMEKSIEVLKDHLATVKTGRANPGLLESIKVEYYGVLTPINQVASITVPEPRMLVIEPWDKNIIKEIEKAITNSDLGVNPINEGNLIRIVLPPLTEERRKELTKLVKKYGEEIKIALRNERRDALDQLKKMKKEGTISEDLYNHLEKEVLDILHSFEKKVDELVENKEKEILTV